MRLKRFIPQTLGGPWDNIWNEKFFGPFMRRYILRYRHLLRLVKNNKCRRIMEIGILRGDTAAPLIKAAKSNFRPSEVEFYGFDLFDPSLDYGGPRPLTLKEAREKLERTGAQIKLFKGDTRTVLPEVVGNLPKMDLIFIDGGHSYNTVKSDWENSKRLMNAQTIVVFDDLDYPGVRKVVDNINRIDFAVELLPGCHKPLVKVQRRKIGKV